MALVVANDHVQLLKECGDGLEGTITIPGISVFENFKSLRTTKNAELRCDNSFDVKFQIV